MNTFESRVLCVLLASVLALTTAGCPADDDGGGGGEEDAIIIGQDQGDDLELGVVEDTGDTDVADADDARRDGGGDARDSGGGDAGDATPDEGRDATICEPESTRCEGDAVVTCLPSGAAESRFECGDDGTCEVVEGEAVCAVACEPNAIGCQGPFTAFICDAAGEVLTPLPCRTNQYCEAGGCFPQVCEPDASACDDGVVTTCDERGASQLVAACDSLPDCAESDFGCRCADDGCAPRVCLPGSSVCAGNNVRPCAEDGSGYLPLESCGSGNCAFGACVPARCDDGETICANELLLTCDEGTWVEADDCEDEGLLCLVDGDDAECGAPVCLPDSRTCDGDTVLACDARGAALTRTECDTDERCVGGACVPDPCAGDVPPPGCSLECDVEGETEVCDGACGAGLRTCVDGIFGACVSGDDCVDFDRACRPAALEVTLDGEALPTGGLVDVAFLFDVSRSFGDDLLTFRSAASDLAASLADAVGDDELALGLASFSDAPCLTFGLTDDYGYQLDQALSTSLGTFSVAVGELSILNGNDLPESQLEAMYQALVGSGVAIATGACASADIAPSNMGWSGGRRFLFVSTDAVFHRPADTGYPYPHGVDDVIAAAQERSVVVSFLQAGGTTDPAAATIATATGGGVYPVGTASAGMADAAVEAVTEALGTSDVSVRVEGPGAELVARVEPASIRGLDFATVDELRFTVQLVADAPATGEDYDLELDLVFTVGGAEVARHPVTVHVPAAYDELCANRPPIIREWAPPATVRTGAVVPIPVTVDEPDDDEVALSLRVSHGSVDSSGFLIWTAPANPRIATLTVTATDPEGLSASAAATVAVLGGECTGAPALVELGDHGGTVYATSTVSQRVAEPSCGSAGWGEALFALHVTEPGTWRISREGEGAFYVRTGACTTDLECGEGEGAIDVELAAGDYFLIAEGNEDERVTVGFRRAD